MEQTITIEELYDLLFKKLSSMPGLKEMYIGKTNDIERRRKEHLQKDGFEFTKEIAHGDEKTIKDGEIYLIEKFKSSELPCKNIDDKGQGDPANKLYVSYSYNKSSMSTIDDLDDDDLDLDTVYKLIKE